jgi:hypothetical protein
MDLARLQATLRHLATDPDRSETVSGKTLPSRVLMESRREKIVGEPGPYCDEDDVSATVAVDYYRTWATVQLQLQPPDRPDQIPTRVLLGSSVATVGSNEVELHDGEQTVQLLVQTFDWYIRVGGFSISAVFMPTVAATPSSFNAAPGFPFPAMVEAQLPGLERNAATKMITFTVEVHSVEDAASRHRRVVVKPYENTPSFGGVHVITEETLYSGAKLRTFFDVSMRTRDYWVPDWFFRAEEKCERLVREIIGKITELYVEAHQYVPPHVPIEGIRLKKAFERLRAAMPVVVERTARELGHPLPDRRWGGG